MADDECDDIHANHPQQHPRRNPPGSVQQEARSIEDRKPDSDPEGDPLNPGDETGECRSYHTLYELWKSYLSSHTGITVGIYQNDGLMLNTHLRETIVHI